MDTALAPQALDTATTTTEKKPIFSLTAKAVEQVREVMKSQGYEGYTLTVRVVPAGCSGLGYDLNLMREGKPGDILFEQDGVKIATDPVSVKYLSGTQIDYQVTDTAAGFKFENPNAKSGCGCGSSFSV
jgi:iron-sulfur cluster assembly accessory protein